MKRTTAIALISALTGAVPASAELEFQAPPPEILELADYERAPSLSMDSKREYMLLKYRPTYKDLAELKQREMRLAGLRINPVTNISSMLTYYNALKVRKVSGAEAVPVLGLPSSPRIAYVSWSPDEKKVAFTNTEDEGVALWVLDVETARARRLTGAVLNANLGEPYTWLPDSAGLLARILPEDRPRLIDPGAELPKGPVVAEGTGEVSQTRTYQDLLKTPADKLNFETLATSELRKVLLDGSSRLFKPAAIYAGESMAPGGKYVLVTTLHRPFSYIVPLWRFPKRETVYDLEGREVRTVNEVPLTEVMPKGFSAVRKGRRDLEWRADKPATLFYVEALDGGDPAAEAEFRDQAWLWDAPFASEPRPFFRTPQRFRSVDWGDDSTAVVSDWWYDTRNMRTYLADPSDPEKAPRLLHERNYQDIYSDPGSFATRRLPSGRRVLLTGNGKAWLLGEGYTKEGQFPFVDELDLSTMGTERVYRSELKDRKETLLSLEGPSAGEALVLLQSSTDYPNYFFRDIRTGGLERITSFKNPFESIKDARREIITYKRRDGVELTGKLYLPAGYDPGRDGRLPLLIWAYPREFKDRDSAGQSDKTPNDFIYPYYGSFIYWITRGYAVLDDASFPIVGEGKKEPNDTFLKQLKMNAEAAIKAVEKLGVADPGRVAIGGHSYGAFMAANLLTHTDLFACGIARSGAYNRTLTPFGFQGEQRNYWDAPEIYGRMSPFMSADRMKRPLLLVHGAADNNPGTFTLQTERYFQALKNLGAPVRMVLLPEEAHSYQARENIFHLLWEQDVFLEKCLKGE